MQKRIKNMKSCKNYECAKYADKDGAQIMGENTIFAKVQMESKPAMCGEWEAKNLMIGAGGAKGYFIGGTGGCTGIKGYK